MCALMKANSARARFCFPVRVCGLHQSFQIFVDYLRFFFAGGEFRILIVQRGGNMIQLLEAFAYLATVEQKFSFHKQNEMAMMPPITRKSIAVDIRLRLPSHRDSWPCQAFQERPDKRLRLQIMLSKQTNAGCQA